jgi:aminopeptidase
VARRLLGNDDIDALWEVLTPILRLDAEDPEEAWRQHIDRLQHRVAALEARRLVALHFHGGGTDLKLGPLEGAGWFSGGLETNWGRKMIVNMPTEEVFTTPATGARKAPRWQPGPSNCSEE